MNETSENDKHLKLFIEKSGVLVGSVSAAVVAGLVPGFGGMLFSGLTSIAVEQAYKEIGYGIKKRLLNEREEIRISAAFTIAVSRIRQRLDAGDNLRCDGFFEEEPGNRAAANEILEGVLLVSQREHEEFKIRFYGYLIANISFDSTIDRAYANFLLRVGETLSYRQLLILEIVGAPFEHGLEPRLMTSADANSAREVTIESERKLGLLRGVTLPISQLKPDLHEEIRNLEQRGLVEQLESNSKFFFKIRLSKIGIDVQRLMQLDRIGPEHLEYLISIFKITGKYTG